MKPKTPNNGFVFFCEGRPASYQGSPKSKEVYKRRISTCYQRHFTGAMPDVPLFANVYHFYNEDVQIDADNISKPTWDALSKVAFSDDKQIIIRSAASIDMRKSGLEVDLDTIPSEIRFDFIDSIYSKPHTIFIEVGEVDNISKLFIQSSLWK